MALSIENMTAKIDLMNSEIEEIRSKHQTMIQTMISDSLKEFFENTPEIAEIFWVQYTPYWNDGEECIFSVREFQFKPTSLVTGDDDYFDYTEYYEPYDSYDSILPVRSVEAIDEDIATFNAVRGLSYDDFEKSVPKEFFNNNRYELYTINYGYDENRRYVEKPIQSQKSRTVDETVSKLEIEKKRTIRAAELNWNPKQAVDNFKLITKMFSKISEDAMQEIYGDHVRVSISRDGTTVEEFKHE